MHPYLTRAVAAERTREWRQQAERATLAKQARQARQARRARRGKQAGELIPARRPAVSLARLVPSPREPADERRAAARRHPSGKRAA